MTSDSNIKKKKRKIVKREVRSAVHLPRNSQRPDLHYVRELVTYEDGVAENKVSLKKEYQRPVYVTAPNKRNHREKKEFEYFENLVVKMCTQSDMYRVAASMLGTPHLATQPRKIKESPYIYGIDMSASSLIKLESLKKNDYIQTPYRVATFDIETDVVHGDGRDRILIASIVYPRNGKYYIHAVVDSEWVADITDYPKMLAKRFKEIDPEVANNCIISVNMHSDQLELIKDIFKVANKWAPDWLSIWNMDFDIYEVILNIIEKRGKNPIDYLCDLRLPRELRRFDFHLAPDKFVKSDGKVVAVAPVDRWHETETTTTFMLVDQMRTFRALRLHKPKEVSYALDYILRKYGGTQKLEIDAVKHLSGGEWHAELQKYHKVEYGAYNLLDNIGPLKLDSHMQDLRVSLPIFADSADFNSFGGSNRKTYPALYDYCMEEEGAVIGVGCNMSKVYEEYSKDPEIEGGEVYRKRLLGVDGWIQTLDQENALPIGVRPYLDYFSIVTSLKTNNVDMDSVSSYPSCTIAGNISKLTCLTMTICIEGFTDDKTKEVSLGLILGNTNALEICSEVASLPKGEDIVQMCLSGDIDNFDY